MAITSFEISKSRRITSGRSATTNWIIQGTADEAAALAELTSASTGIFNSQLRQSITVEPEYADASASGGVWYGTVEYAVNARQLPQSEGDSNFNFDIGAGSTHITQSRGTLNTYASSGGSAATGYGAINNGEGTEIISPEYSFSETWIKANADIDAAYKLVLFNLVGKINDATFKGFAIGECLFLGATGTKRNSSEWEITYRFKSIPNQTNIQIAGITVSTKRGHDFLWVEYEDKARDPGIVKRPIMAHVERVYLDGDFSTLDIGTT